MMSVNYQVFLYFLKLLSKKYNYRSTLLLRFHVNRSARQFNKFVRGLVLLMDSTENNSSYSRSPLPQPMHSCYAAKPINLKPITRQDLTEQHYSHTNFSV